MQWDRVKQTFQKQQNNSFPRNRNADHICNTNLVTVFLCLISGKSLACPTTLIKSNVQYCRNLISIESKQGSVSYNDVKIDSMPAWVTQFKI